MAAKTKQCLVKQLQWVIEHVSSNFVELQTRNAFIQQQASQEASNIHGFAWKLFDRKRRIKSKHFKVTFCEVPDFDPMSTPELLSRI